MNGYKIMTNNRTSIYSKGVLKVKYPPKTYVQAHKSALALGYGLLIFKDLKSVESFGANEQEYIVCRVRYAKSDTMELPPMRLTDITNVWLRCLRAYKRLFDMKSSFGRPWPDGTIMVKKLYVVE